MYPRARGRFPGRTCHDTSLKRSIEARDEDARTSPPRTMEATGAGVGTARGKQTRAASPLFGALSAAPPSFPSPALPVLFRPPHQGRPSPFRRRGPRKRRARVRGRRAGSKRERPPLSLARSARRRRCSYHPHSPSFFAPPIKAGPLPNPNHPSPKGPRKRRARVRGRRAGSKRERPPLALALSARRRRRPYHPHSPSVLASRMKAASPPNPNHPKPNHPKSPPL